MDFVVCGLFDSGLESVYCFAEFGGDFFGREFGGHDDDDEGSSES